MAENGHYGKDIKAQFNSALINYGMKTKGSPLKQKDFNPEYSSSHINNVASGRSSNPNLRKKIERFIRKYNINV